MAKGRDSNFYIHGLFGGYTAHRYAPPAVRPKLKPIFNGERRAHVVRVAMKALRGWQQTPFEQEGAVRAALRSGLCLQGYNWHRAEAQAADVVNEALRLLGAVRPTWEQGQREYVEPRENCSWCGGPRDPFQRSARFCSPHCAKMAALTRDYDGKAKGDNARALMLAVARRTRNQKRKCLACHGVFYPDSDHSTMKFCSNSCAYEHRKTEEAKVHGKNCATCESPFMAKLPTAMYCSRPCAVTASRRRQGIMPLAIRQVTCEVCGDPFDTTSSTAICCSNNCKVFRGGFRRGQFKRVTPRIIDYLFRQQGLRITDARIAA